MLYNLAVYSLIMQIFLACDVVQSSNVEGIISHRNIRKCVLMIKAGSAAKYRAIFRLVRA